MNQGKGSWGWGGDTHARAHTHTLAHTERPGDCWDREAAVKEAWTDRLVNLGCSDGWNIRVDTARTAALVPPPNSQRPISPHRSVFRPWEFSEIRYLDNHRTEQNRISAVKRWTIWINFMIFPVFKFSFLLSLAFLFQLKFEVCTIHTAFSRSLLSVN